MLKGHGLATADMTSEFLRLQMLLRCPAKVTWQDHQQSKLNAVTTTTTDTPVAATGAGVGVFVNGAGCAGVGTVFENQAVMVSRRQDQANFESLLQFPDLNYAPSREYFLCILKSCKSHKKRYWLNMCRM